jgi:hypothetical protein
MARIMPTMISSPTHLAMSQIVIAVDPDTEHVPEPAGRAAGYRDDQALPVVLAVSVAVTGAVLWRRLVGGSRMATGSSRRAPGTPQLSG